MSQNYNHVPVLLDEVLELLNPKTGENFVDATLGGGGYSLALLEKVKPKGKVLSIDLDAQAIDNFQEKAKAYKNNAVVAHGNFAYLDKIVEHKKFFNISGIVADIGLSSFQLDSSGRGITFQKKETLDMRFDQGSTEPDAKFILNNATPQELDEVFTKYGEEKFSRQIVRKIINFRQDTGLIKYTTDLYQIIESALPKPVKHKASDSARRIFQALRIAVNHELSNLEEFLPKALDLLNPGGRLVIVSFHSLEDRIVKQFFRDSAKGCVCPVDFPQCLCGKNPLVKILTKKPVTASEAELSANPRSKPAKLRAIVKL